MNTENALLMLKQRLNRLPGDTTLDDYLTARINSTIEQLEQTGIVLDPESVSDLLLVVDMAAWQYLNRDKPGAMPDWLRLQRRERWVNQEVAENAAG